MLTFWPTYTYHRYPNQQTSDHNLGNCVILPLGVNREYSCTGALPSGKSRSSRAPATGELIAANLFPAVAWKSSSIFAGGFHSVGISADIFNLVKHKKDLEQFLLNVSMQPKTSCRSFDLFSTWIQGCAMYLHLYLLWAHRCLWMGCFMHSIKQPKMLYYSYFSRVETSAHLANVKPAKFPDSRYWDAEVTLSSIYLWSMVIINLFGVLLICTLVHAYSFSLKVRHTTKCWEMCATCIKLSVYICSAQHHRWTVQLISKVGLWDSRFSGHNCELTFLCARQSQKMRNKTSTCWCPIVDESFWWRADYWPGSNFLALSNCIYVICY